MKFLPLLAANLFRRKTRLLLTLGSFAAALFLFGLLATIRQAFEAGIEAAGADRLLVVNKVSFIMPLPVAYREKLAKIRGVTRVASFWWFGGVYRDERNFFPQFAVDPAHHRAMFPEFVVADAEWEAFLADRRAAIAGVQTALRHGWKVGDRIPIKGAIFPGLWEFNLVGTYRGTRPQDDTTQFWFRTDYLEEKGPPEVKGLVGWYMVQIERPDLGPAVGRAIDESFANSAWETRTQTEKALVTGFIKQMGNVELLLLSVGGVVFLTLLLVTGNTMAIAVRERTSELAVLKAIGYSDGFVLGLVLLESALQALVGGATGLALARAYAQRGDPTGGLLPVFYLPAGWLALGLGAALLVGIVAGLAPGLAGMRLRVVEALRKV